MSDERIGIQIQHPELTLAPHLCRRTVSHVADGEGVRIESLTVVLSDHQTVHDLNRRYLGHDYVTDVLAFDYRESAPATKAVGDAGGGALDGEIYVDLDTAHERHEEFGVGFQHEALRYLIHGMLHLVGYADKSSGEKKKMRTLEDRYLEEMQVPTTQ